MRFPFTIKYKNRLSDKVTSEDFEDVLKCIDDFLGRKMDSPRIIKDNKIIFTPRNLKVRWNWNSLMTIEKGIFTIEHKEDGIILTYEFFMYHLFIWVTVMSLIMGVISKNVWAGVVGFLWVGGMNWIVGLTSQESMHDEITEEINLLIENKKKVISEYMGSK